MEAVQHMTVGHPRRCRAPSRSWAPRCRRRPSRSRLALALITRC